MSESLKIKKKSSKKAKKDPQKERIFKSLCLLLEGKGLSVRREELKQGHGWRVASGACRVKDQPFLFVDRKLPQDEQIEFVLGKISDLNVVIVPEDLKDSTLPEKMKQNLCPAHSASFPADEQQEEPVHDAV